jgi:hypothetical protein
MAKPQIGEAGTVPLPPAKESHRDWKRFERIAQIAMILGVLFLVYFLIASAAPAALRIYDLNIRPFVVQYWPNFLSVLALIALGFVLYTIRGYRSLWFGIAEMAAAVGIGWYAVNKFVLGDVSDAIVFLFASLYLSGRAWINISSKIQPLQIDEQ